VLLVVFLVRSVQLSSALTTERAHRAELASLVGEQQTVLDVVDSPKTVKAVLRPTKSGSTAYGKLYTRPDLPNVVLMAANLVPAPAGQVYHVWLTAAGQPPLVGTLLVNDQGFGLLVFRAETSGPAYQGAQIVLQPESSTTPVGEAVLTWQGSQ
jgi:hypothetical protein